MRPAGGFLVIGKGQVRLRDVKKEVTELADSICKVGFLKPIVVCRAEKPGQYEISTGQCRFLAHQQLKKETILAAILDEKGDVPTAKVLSGTENLMGRDPKPKDLIDVCTALYRHYGGSIQADVDATACRGSRFLSMSSTTGCSRSSARL